jgi:microfibrillar-associated protein 1
MEKVKVTRYMTGKRPDWAPEEFDSDDELQLQARKITIKKPGMVDIERIEEITKIEINDEEAKADPRLARLMKHRQDREDDSSSDEEEDGPRRRRRHEAEILEDAKESSGDESENDDEIEQRRQRLKKRALARQVHEAEELLEIEEEQEKKEDASSSEYETEYESEEDEGPRLKPVFVRQKDRMTVKNLEIEEAKEKRHEVERKKLAEERKKYTLSMIEKDAKKDFEMERDENALLEACDSDDGDPDVEFEAWKFRELQRLKRDREAREAEEAEQAERDRRRAMTEEQRLEDLKLNPRVVTNKQEKGKMKFLQKYYHRGAFYMDEENELMKRNTLEPTLEDHCDKSVLPSVMQVKDFGRSGRTKWTHLTSEDTTAFDNPWGSKDNQTHLKIGGGMKQTFEKPSAKRKKMS